MRWARVAAAVIAVATMSTAAGGVAQAKGSLTISPTPVVLGSTFTLAGCGYPTPTSLSFEVVGPDVKYFTSGEPLGADSGGCFSDQWTAWWSTPGDYQITSFYRDAKGSTRKVTVAKFAVTA
jgi:hypothetical protein